jgi:predicted TIM-barrel fold metal-dependent hydrolase
MIIDAHNHPDWHGHNLDRFLANMAQYGIDQTWLLSWESPVDEYDLHHSYTSLASDAGPIPFSRCLSYTERAPEKFVLGYAPDPRRPDAIDRLQAAIEIYGVRVYGELKLRLMLDNPDVLRVFRFCGQQGLPVTVHLDYELDTGQKYPRPNWWYGGGIDALERAVRACPETTFIGHAPGFWSHISSDGLFDQVMYPTGPVVPGGKVPKMLRQYPNLYADLSAGSALNALMRDAAFTTDFILEFQDRLLYGRDSFDNRLQEFLGGLDLPGEARSRIYAGNALTLVPERPANQNSASAPSGLHQR